MSSKTLAIYVHWPFCLSKCPYCGFNSIPENNRSIYEAVESFLLMDLKNELEKIGDRRRITSVFFGGGTPSLMNPAALDNILNLLGKWGVLDSDVEISLEANPQTFDEGKMLDFRSSGINRISVGIQSFQSENLQFLGRTYDGPTAQLAAGLVANIFQNFSMDFIHGYQNLKNWEQDLEKAIEFGPHHISAYQLTLEEGTPFFQRRFEKALARTADEKLGAKFHHFTHKFLEANGLGQYEISNYAQPGYESRHHMTYWKYEDYLGLGPGAHSRITISGDKYEIEKKSHPSCWMNSLAEGGDGTCNRKALIPHEEFEEMMIMGLRLTKGMELSWDRTAFRFPEKKLQFLRKNKLMENDPTRLQLTYAGRIRLNAVLEFLLADLPGSESAPRSVPYPAVSIAPQING
ncbi:MAG: radical SAM family heme chaperone HemW [Holosporaceae bacterium]|jgi:oxygen-independent coproporphyrinogen-3 oxidase|nr:radical SAM family heme chaperone HemW [Holosporaceae bacterium]